MTHIKSDLERAEHEEDYLNALAEAHMEEAWESNMESEWNFGDAIGTYIEDEEFLSVFVPLVYRAYVASRSSDKEHENEALVAIADAANEFGRIAALRENGEVNE